MDGLKKRWMRNIWRICVYIYEIYDNFKECMGNVAKTILYIDIYIYLNTNTIQKNMGHMWSIQGLYGNIRRMPSGNIVV